MGMKPRLNDIRANFPGTVTTTKNPGEETPLLDSNLATKSKSQGSVLCDYNLSTETKGEK